jgi:lysophospholipase L1-like esterase
VNPSTKLVTLTVGGIDAGLKQVFAACAPDPMSPACQSTVTANLVSLGPVLAGTYAKIAQALPDAKIVVLSYPLQFEPGLSAFGDQINSGPVALNAVIQAAVAGVNNPRVVLVDATQEFAGHGIGSPVPYIAFDPADLAALANFHPNALGNSLGYYWALLYDGVLRRS